MIRAFEVPYDQHGGHDGQSNPSNDQKFAELVLHCMFLFRSSCCRSRVIRIEYDLIAASLVQKSALALVGESDRALMKGERKLFSTYDLHFSNDGAGRHGFEASSVCENG